MAKSKRHKSIERQFIRGGATTLILSFLDERPMHGYELIQIIRDRTEGIFDFSDGTVYPLLYCLRDKGFLSSETDLSEEGRTRRIYHLTDAGRQALRGSVADWRLFAKGMGMALGKAGG